MVGLGPGLHFRPVPRVCPGGHCTPFGGPARHLKHKNMAEDKNNFLPADWKDNDRMNFMFSAFPESREVNPKHWDSKLHFWTKLILDSCRLESNDGVCIDLATLQRRFSRNGLTPLGLNTVINEMVKEGKLQRKEDFVKCGSEGWMAWSFGLAKKSFWWGTRTVFGGDANDGGDNGQFVVVNLAKVGTDKTEIIS